ncbi:MAG: hypothetical protein QNJ90_12155 [Planctomycetota bacterium]|nr:hypothetical protein [Planctomycetota bacterium]
MCAARNPYNSALGLEHLDLRALIASGELNYRSAIMAALVEHGAPLALEHIARRLHEMGMGESRDHLLRSLRKAWGGSQALRKLKDGRLSLDVNAPDARFLEVRVSLIMREDDARDPAPKRPPDDQALTEAEVREAISGEYLHSYSGAKLAAIVTEATRRPMTTEEINAYLARLTSHFQPLVDPRRGAVRSPLVDIDEAERLRVNPDAPSLRDLRTKVRKLAERARLARASEERGRAARERRRRARLVERAEVLARRRCLLQVYEVGNSPILVGHTDPAVRHAATFVSPVSREDAAWLPDCDVLIGLDIHDVVERLGIDPEGRRLVDLAPPQKTKSLGPRRPPLKLTTNRLLRHTLGSWARIASRSRIAKLARKSDELRHTMATDLDTLATYYWYGVRNSILYANWHDADMLVPAPFAEAGDARMAEILQDLLGHEVRMRLRGNRMSDPPEDLQGLITHASWLSFTLQTMEFRVEGPPSSVLAVERVHGS